jgi:hypothetical protein
MSNDFYTKDEGHEAIKRLENGTKVKHKYKWGEHEGVVINGEISGGHIIYDGEKYSPTGAAKIAIRELKKDGYTVNGWTWWKYYDEESGSWKPLNKIRDPE